MTATYANPKVLAFYREMPFNLRESVSAHVKKIRSRNAVGDYPALEALLSPGVSILEVGCGTGWLSNTISFYNQAVSVRAIDFNPKAIAELRT